MLSNNTSLSASYIRANWALLTLALGIFLYCFAGAKINTDLIPADIPDPKIRLLILVAFYFVAWIYQAIQWRLQANESKVKYLSKIIHLGVNLLAFLTCFLCYPKLSVGTPFHDVGFWWIVLYLFLGLVSGGLIAFLSLHTLLIRQYEEAETLGLPKVPIATKVLYITFLPILLIILGVYFGIQQQASTKLVYLGTLLFILAFLKEILSRLLPYYFTQDENGYRLKFTDRVSGLKKAIDRHDYSYRVHQYIESKLVRDLDTTVAPEVLQQNLVKKIESSNSMKYKAKFLGGDNNNNLIIEIVFEAKEIPPQIIEVPSSYFQDSFNSYIEKKSKSKANIEKAISHAFNESTLRVWKEQKLADASLEDLVKAKEYELLMQKLAETNEDVNKRGDGGWTPLCHAAANGDENAVRILTEHAADPNIKNLLERAPLHFAARYLNYNISKLLLDCGANPNDRDDENRTPLMIVSELGNIRIVKLLIERGADVDLIDDLKKSAIDYATEGKHGHIAKLLRTK